MLEAEHYDAQADLGAREELERIFARAFEIANEPRFVDGLPLSADEQARLSAFLRLQAENMFKFIRDPENEDALPAILDELKRHHSTRPDPSIVSASLLDYVNSQSMGY